MEVVFFKQIFIRWMASPWRLSEFLCSLSRSWWCWWLTRPWPAQSVSSPTQTHLNRTFFAVWACGTDSDSVHSPSDSGSFDGTRLLWEVPRIVTPLVGEGAGFESRSLTLGVEGVLLDKPTTAARGFTLVQQGHLIQIGVPFGAEGGYRKVQSVPSKKAFNKCKLFCYKQQVQNKDWCHVEHADDIMTNSRFYT